MAWLWFKFQMGSQNGDGDEKPVHAVYLDAYWIDQTEVTNGMFVEFLNNNLSSITVENSKRVPYDGNLVYDLICTNCYYWEDQISWNGESFKVMEGYENHPVALVSWFGADNYCSWVTRRLPTEAEWEKAASWDEDSQAQRVYPWGNGFDCKKGNFNDETKLDEYVVPGGENCDGFDTTAPVGSFSSGVSFYEVFDMAGNVWEWVADWYSDTYYSDSTSINPTGPNSGKFKILRGGSWSVSIDVVRSSNRHTFDPTTSSSDIGFRCATGASE